MLLSSSGTQGLGKSMTRCMMLQVAVDQYGRAGQVLMSAARVSGIPHAFVLDDKGIVQYHGHPADPQFERAVKQVCPMTLPFSQACGTNCS